MTRAPTARLRPQAAARSPEAEEVARSLLFDIAHYIALNRDVTASGLDPIEHFQNGGWQENRDPNPYFDIAYYREHALGAADDPAGPLLHYLRHGEAAGERPSPLFDPAWYREHHDVPPGGSALAHFLGRRHRGEVSPNRDFDVGYYTRTYPDVATAQVDPFQHFIQSGRDEGRLPMPPVHLLRNSGLFDENFYLLQNADVRAAALDPETHFLEAGWSERRYPNPYFNPAWYIQAHGPIDLNPLVHYALIGERRGLRPSLAFDPAWYRKTYSIPPHASPLAHYLANRRTQRFSPLPLFDVEFYLATYGPRIGPNRDPFAHYLVAGGPQDLDPAPFFRTGPYRRLHMTRDGAERAASAARAELESPLLHFIAHFVLDSRPSGAGHGPAG